MKLKVLKNAPAIKGLEFSVEGDIRRHFKLVSDELENGNLVINRADIMFKKGMIIDNVPVDAIKRYGAKFDHFKRLDEVAPKAEQEIEKSLSLIEAIGHLDTSKDFTKAGNPKVKALEAILDKELSSDEVKEAYKTYLEAHGNESIVED